MIEICIKKNEFISQLVEKDLFIESTLGRRNESLNVVEVVLDIVGENCWDKVGEKIGKDDV